MKKFKVNDWIEFQDSPETKVLGVVTKVPKDGGNTVSVRWARSNYLEGEVAASTLTKSMPTPFIIKGHLASDLQEPRSERGILAAWFASNHINYSSESVHNKSDINLLAKKVGTDFLPPFIHISSHGYIEASTRPCIQLVDDKLFLDDPDTVKTFSHFEGYPIFFSACLRGNFPNLVKELQAAAKLGPILVSTREVCDNEAILFSLLLYQYVIDSCIPFKDAVSRCIKALRLIGFKGSKEHEQACAQLF
jgi:hypothetical protein